MKPRSERSLKLYDILLERGYPEGFCYEVTANLNTDWTADRMIGYLRHYDKLPMEDVADEVLAILSDRERIMQKKEAKRRIQGLIGSCGSLVRMMHQANDEGNTLG